MEKKQEIIQNLNRIIDESRTAGIPGWSELRIIRRDICLANSVMKEHIVAILSWLYSHNMKGDPLYTMLFQ